MPVHRHPGVQCAAIWHLPQTPPSSRIGSAARSIATAIPAQIRQAANSAGHPRVLMVRSLQVHTATARNSVFASGRSQWGFLARPDAARLVLPPRSGRIQNQEQRLQSLPGLDARNAGRTHSGQDLIGARQRLDQLSIGKVMPQRVHPAAGT